MTKELALDGAFYGFRLDGKIVEQIIKSVGTEFKHLQLKNAGDRCKVKLTTGSMGERIFTDKKRLFNSVKYFLDEAEGHLKSNKTIDISFSYYEELHCARLAIEDHGDGITKEDFDKVGQGTPTDGGWAGIVEQLRGWVEDVWVVTKAVDGSRAKSLITDREVLKENKNAKGTMLVMLFNFVSDLT